MIEQDYEQLTLFPADSPANRSAAPGSAEAQKMTVTSGRTCFELCRSCGPVGLLAKMLLESSVWRSTRCYLTWKASATPARRLLFRLVPSMPRTDAIDAPLWPTVRSHETGDYQYSKGNHEKPVLTLTGAVKTMWPTPTARDCKCANSMEHLTRDTGGKNHTEQLANAVKLFATPQARDYRSGQAERWINPERSQNLNDQVKLFTTPCAADAKGSTGGNNHRSLRTDVQGQLNPDWVEWLMGFPTGWTSL